MTHTPNSDASERARLIAELNRIAKNTGVFDDMDLVKAADMLRADAETIRRLNAEVEGKTSIAQKAIEQLAARSAEVEALRKAICRAQKHLTPSGFNALLDCLQLEGVALPQEKSRDAG